MRSFRSGRVAAGLLSLALVGSVGAGVLGVRAQASPTGSLDDVRRQVAAARQHLNQLQDKAEAAAERYNAGRLDLAAARRLSKDKQARADKAQQRLDDMRVQVSAFAADLFKNGNVATLELADEADDPQAFVDRAAYSDHLAEQKADTLANLRVAEHDSDVTRLAARQALNAQQQVLNRLAADKRVVQEAAAEAKDVLNQLVAQERELERQARLAAERARRASQARAAAQALAEANAAAAAAAEAEQERQASDAAASAFDNESDSGDSGDSGSSGDSGDTPDSPSGDAASTAVASARAQIGDPYVWGADGPSSFDCSGLTMYAYAKAGVYLPHSSSAQFGSGRHVSRGELQPGDLVFFGSPIHHVGIYVGGGTMIHAPHAGASVRYASIDRGDYAGAVRPVG